MYYDQLTGENRDVETIVRIRVSECLNSEKNRQNRAEWNWCGYGGAPIGKTASQSQLRTEQQFRPLE